MNNLTRSDVLILKVTDPPRSVLEALIKKGHAVVEVREIADVTERIARLAHPVLMVYCGGTEQQTTSFANKLASITELALFPLVFIGRAIAKHDRMLSQSFRSVTVIEYPGEPNKILSAVQELSSAWEDIEQQPIEQPKRAPKNEPKIVKTIERTTIQPNSSEPIVSNSATYVRPSLELSEQVSTIATQIFSEISNLKVSEGALGGEQLVRGIKPEQLEKLGLLPSDLRLRYKADHLLRATDKWGRAHISRVAFVSDKILNVLESGQGAHSDSTKSAALLYASSFANNESLMRRDYSLPEAQKLKSSLVEKIKESAAQIKQLDQKTADIVGEMANILGDNKPSSEELYLMASTVLAADIVNRICNAHGHWSPSGAYQLMRKIRSGNTLNMHPKVVSCIMLTLTEASNSEASVLLLPRLPRAIKETLSEIRSCKKLPISANEIALPLTELQPGMEVSQSVIAYDGTMLLKSGLVLDNDLIIRLWQLSSIKPLLIPMVILSENDRFVVSNKSGSKKTISPKSKKNSSPQQLAA